MSGSRARKIRKKVYPSGIAFHTETRIYDRLADGSLKCGWMRKLYKEAKKEAKKKVK